MYAGKVFLFIMELREPEMAMSGRTEQVTSLVGFAAVSLPLLPSPPSLPSFPSLLPTPPPHVFLLNCCVDV